MPASSGLFIFLTSSLIGSGCASSLIITGSFTSDCASSLIITGSFTSGCTSSLIINVSFASGCTSSLIINVSFASDLLSEIISLFLGVALVFISIFSFFFCSISTLLFVVATTIKLKNNAKKIPI